MPVVPPRPPLPVGSDSPISRESRSSSTLKVEKSTLEASSRRQSLERNGMTQVRKLPTPTPTPSKFQKGEMYHSDYESEWESAKMQTKWRPYHSDTEDLVEPKYRSVKPKLKSRGEAAKASEHAPRRQPSPPCPHQWESHEDIENLQRELRRECSVKNTTLVSKHLEQCLQKQVSTSAARHFAPLDNFRKTQSLTHSKPKKNGKNDFTKEDPETFSVKHERRNVVSNATSSLIKETRRSRSSSATQEFISVKEKAKLLQEMVNSAAPSIVDIESESSESRSTPALKPEEIPGAVRVLPPAIGNSHRSASADLFNHTMTLPALSPHRRLRSKSTDLEQQQRCIVQVDKKIEKFFESRSEEKVMRSKLHSSLHRLQQQPLPPPQRKLESTDRDSPPTIEMTAYRCSSLDEDATDENNAKDTEGYEADTDDTLRRGKVLFKPSKFVPSCLADGSGGIAPIWKPSSQASI